MKHWFSLEIAEHAARKMTRAQYYSTKSWLRQCRRILMQEMGLSK